MEGVPAYGDVLLPLLTDPGVARSFLLADEDGTTTYEQAFDLPDASIFLPSPSAGVTCTAQDPFSLVLREIVIHGAFLSRG